MNDLKMTVSVGTTKKVTTLEGSLTKEGTEITFYTVIPEGMSVKKHILGIEREVEELLGMHYYGE